MSVNKSASTVGTLQFGDGFRLTIWIGANRVSHETIVWQRLAGRRSSRVTGRRLGPFARELREVLDSGEGHWVGTPNQAALDALLALGS